MTGIPGTVTTKLDATYQRFFPVIREKCQRMLADYEESRDIAQETFIRFWRSGLAEGDVRRATAWIFRTSTRLAIDRFRRRKLMPGAPSSSEGEIGDEPHAIDLEARTLARDQLLRLAREVPHRELEMAILSRVDGLGQKEIAEVLEVSERTVRRVLERFDGRLEALDARKECHA